MSVPFKIRYRIVPVKVQLTVPQEGRFYNEVYNLIDEETGAKVNRYPFLSRRSATKRMFQLEAEHRKAGK